MENFASMVTAGGFWAWLETDFADGVFDPLLDPSIRLTDGRKGNPVEHLCGAPARAHRR